uniref:Hint-domain-containing protein n=1 Tax=Trepomonas sp. PC1 TaxID=1076344 RepID=A0A146KJM2_9EUKA|eukprot:JAP95825.1 Hint-domain-containing protein [Trepomonas sp. PC1]
MIEAYQNPHKQKIQFEYTDNKLIEPEIFKDDEFVIVKFKPPQEAKPLRKAYVIAVDTSQSMLEKTSTQQQEDSGLSRIDLVKHALKSIVMTMQEDDLITIISFNNAAQIVHDLQKPNKARITGVMNDLQCQGQTNIYDAVRLIFEQQQKIKNYHIVSMLFTDGQPTVEPPRGTLETIKKYVKNVDVKPVNCFGFGYQLNGRLLYEISKATSGWFSFISDQSVLGTVFVNFWAAQMAVCSHFCVTGGDVTKYVEVSAGVEKDVRFQLGKFSTIQIYNDTEKAEIASLWKVVQQPVASIFLKELAVVPTLVFPKAHERMNNLKHIVDQLPEEFQMDFQSDDTQKGQLSKAVENQDFFECWGRNHIFMFCRAHQLQVCPNFYENSLQKYVSEQISEYQNIFENIYCGIPLIKHSQNQVKIEKLDRNMYYNAAGGCYSGDNTVKLNDQTTIKVKDLKKGMILENGLIVSKLVVSPGGDCYSNKNGLLISAYHPVFIKNQWFFPIEIFSKQQEKLDTYYNILFDNPVGKTCFVNETEVAILGHQMKGDVIAHEYFGHRVIADLQAVNLFIVNIEWTRHNQKIDGLKMK